MRVEFTLPIKTYSINKYYYSDRQSKTAAARRWEKDTLLHICKYGPQLYELAQAFDAKVHGFKLTLEAVYPANYYLNKEGTVSSRTMDLSNWEKPLIDLLFLPKYRQEGYANLGIDDHFIIELHSRKVSGDDWAIKVCLELVEYSHYK